VVGLFAYTTTVEMNTERLAAEVASRLRAERARLNLTLREAGDRSGVHYVSISRYEQGNHLPTVEALYRLAEAYGVEPGILLPPMASVADLPKQKGKKP
jgi:transcriptional regulator with XRE-family HTH domain